MAENFRDLCPHIRAAAMNAATAQREANDFREKLMRLLREAGEASPVQPQPEPHRLTSAEAEHNADVLDAAVMANVQRVAKQLLARMRRDRLNYADQRFADVRMDAWRGDSSSYFFNGAWAGWRRAGALVEPRPIPFTLVRRLP